jgi:hypothetical protein
VFGDAKLLRDFFVGESMDAAEQQNPPAAFRQASQGVGEHLQLLIAAGGLGGVGPFL